MLSQRQTQIIWQTVFFLIWVFCNATAILLQSPEAYEEAYNVLKMKFDELYITIDKAMVMTDQEHALYNGFENVFIHDINI